MAYDVSPLEEPCQATLVEHRDLVDVVLGDKLHGRAEVIFRSHGVKRLACHDFLNRGLVPFMLGQFFDVSQSDNADQTVLLVDNGDGQEDGNGAYIKGSRGAVYIVAGSSAQATGVSNHPVMHVSLNQLGSLVLNIDGDRLDARFLDNVGSIQDYLTILKSPGGNQAPSVDAGGDQTLILPATASLTGIVSDDGLPAPPSTVTTAWDQVSGQGTVSLVNATMVNATASFPAPDTYVLRLTADDGELTSNDVVTITVLPAGTPPAPTTLDIRVAAGTDDAEENSSGSVVLTSTDLELIRETSDQTVGMRFNGVTVPQGTTIALAP